MIRIKSDPELFTSDQEQLYQIRILTILTRKSENLFISVQFSLFLISYIFLRIQKTKITRKSEEISCYKGLDVIFRGIQTSSLAFTSFVEAQG